MVTPTSASDRANEGLDRGVWLLSTVPLILGCPPFHPWIRRKGVSRRLGS